MTIKSFCPVCNEPNGHANVCDKCTLLPCSLCGSKAHLVFGERIGMAINCTGCALRLYGHAGDRAGPTARWNTRTLSTPRVEVSEPMIDAACLAHREEQHRQNETNAIALHCPMTSSERARQRMRLALEAAIRAGEVKP